MTTSAARFIVQKSSSPFCFQLAKMRSSLLSSYLNQPFCQNVIGRRGYSSDATTSINKLARTHFVFGANTDVGKTVITVGLVRASALTSSSVNYIKPLQCGGSDEGFVKRYIAQKKEDEGTTAAVHTETLFEWDTPASPHAASRVERKPVSDAEVHDALQSCLSRLHLSSNTRDEAVDGTRPPLMTTWIETAGGVLSPSSASPDNNSSDHSTAVERKYSDDNASMDETDTWGWLTQGDLYMKYKDIAPSVVLIGDGRLGGISATLSSLESLLIRGYDVSGLVLLETDFDNKCAIQEYAMSRQTALDATSRMSCSLLQNPAESIISLPSLPPYPEPLDEWYASSQVIDRLQRFDAYLNESWKLKT